jgi:hypothetical protein
MAPHSPEKRHTTYLPKQNGSLRAFVLQPRDESDALGFSLPYDSGILLLPCVELNRNIKPV